MSRTAWSSNKVLHIVIFIVILLHVHLHKRRARIYRTLERWTGTTVGLIKLRRPLPSRSSLAKSVGRVLRCSGCEFCHGVFSPCSTEQGLCNFVLYIVMCTEKRGLESRLLIKKITEASTPFTLVEYQPKGTQGVMDQHSEPCQYDHLDFRDQQSEPRQSICKHNLVDSRDQQSKPPRQSICQLPAQPCGFQGPTEYTLPKHLPWICCGFQGPTEQTIPPKHLPAQPCGFQGPTEQPHPAIHQPGIHCGFQGPTERPHPRTSWQSKSFIGLL